MAFFSSSLFIWIVIAGIALLILRFIFKVTKTILKLGFAIGLAVAIYIFITQYVIPAFSLP